MNWMKPSLPSQSPAFKQNRKFRNWLRTLIMLLSVGCYGYIAACPVENQTIQITANGRQLTTEVATSHAGHMCGLAFRRELPANQGMLFAYAREQILGFWMKDTYVPLSIAFIDSHLADESISRVFNRNVL